MNCTAEQSYKNKKINIKKNFRKLIINYIMEIIQYNLT